MECLLVFARSRSSVFAFLLSAVLLSSRVTLASDHVDGPVSIANQVADIIDLYAYPTPGRPGALTLILDVYPFVASSGHFSDKVNYNFILRKAAIAPDGSRLMTDPGSEVVVTCKFITPQQVADTQVICATNEPRPRVVGQIAFNQVQQPTVGNNIMLFGGRRADPFFLSKDFAASYMKFERGTPDGNNAVNNLNCLSLVLNIDIDQLFPPGERAPGSAGAENAKLNKEPKNKAGTDKPVASPARKVAQTEHYFIAVAAESVTFDSPDGPPRRIDRIGRPEVTNVSLNFKSADAEIRDIYNADRPFAVPEEKMTTYNARLKKNIDRYDKMDGHQDWSAGELHRLATIIAEDYLVLDPFVACPRSSYFEIERAILLGQPPQSCGGRDPNDNAVNKIYTLYEKGALAMPSMSVNDGLKGPSKPLTTTFPYLAEPYDGIAAWLAQKVANAAKNFL